MNITVIVTNGEVLAVSEARTARATRTRNETKYRDGSIETHEYWSVKPERDDTVGDRTGLYYDHLLIDEFGGWSNLGEEHALGKAVLFALSVLAPAEEHTYEEGKCPFWCHANPDGTLASPAERRTDQGGEDSGSQEVSGRSPRP